MSARRIDEILALPIARAKRLAVFQRVLVQLPDNSAKTAVLNLREASDITDDECAMLIEAHGLEAA